MRRAATSRRNASGGDDGPKKSSDNGHAANGHDGARGSKGRGGGSRSSSSLPKSLAAALVVGCGLALLLLVSRLASRDGDPRAGEAGSGGARPSSGNYNNLRIKKDKKKPPSIASSGAAKGKKSSSPSDPVGLTSPTTDATLHVIFSTDCGSFQHWQSYLFFHAALKVGQPGYVTRIASGCTDKQLKEEEAWHHEHIQSQMSDRFRIHFTPHFSGVKDPETGKVKGDYKFFNKPFGLKHFLEHNELLGLVDEGVTGMEGTMKRPDDVIILCDPDMLLLRPITDDFSNERETLVGPRRKSIYQKKEIKVASHGNPFAQTYGLGTQWRKFDLDAIAGKDSPAKEVSQQDGGLYYPVGPPYVVAADDMYKIAVTWSEFAPKVHKQYPHLLAEMFAYCIAAAHLKLPHMLVDSLMVSAAGVGGEGWRFVKDLPADEACSFASRPDHSVHPVPSVVHYCQRYAVDKYYWGKRKVPHRIFTCDHPLLVEPPTDLGSGKYLSVIPNGGREKQRKEISAEREKMEAFMVCALTRATNDAMTYFKANHCEGKGNMEKRYDMWAGKG